MHWEFHGARPATLPPGVGSLLLGWSAGIAAVQLLPALPPWWAPVLGAGLAFVLAVAVRSLGPPGGAPWRAAALALTAGVCALLCGLSWGVWRAEARLAEALPAALDGRVVLLTGFVDSLPRIDARGVRAAFAVEAAQTLQGAPMQVPARVLLYWRDTGMAHGEPARPGERWRLAVRLQRPHGNANPGGFDLEDWLFQQGLRGTGSVRHDPPPERLPGATGSWRTPVEALRAAVRERLAAALDGAPHAGVVIGLAIGDQQSIAADAWALFAATGTSHLVSISGLHVTMLAGLAGALAGALWRRCPGLVLRMPVRHVRVLAGAIAATGYTLLAGAGVPAQRTLFMLLVAACAWWRGRGVRPTRVLLVALALVLAIDPWAALVPGFWLSFLAVGVLLFAAAAASPSAALAAPSTWAGWRATLVGWGAAQWAVTLGTLPAVLWFFQQFSLVSPLANAVAIPLVSGLVAPLSVAAGLLPAPLSGWLAQAAHALLEPLVALLDWLAGLPWSVWAQARPPLWAVVLGALGALCLLLPRGVPGRHAGLLAMVPLLAPPGAGIADGEARVTLLDVGQGQATLVRTRSHVLLFDVGPAFGRASGAGSDAAAGAAGGVGSDAGARIVLPVLRAAGIDRIDRLVVSHEDADHAGGLASVMAGVAVTAWQSSIPASHPLRGQAAAHRPCVAGERWQWDGVDFQILHPPAQPDLDDWESNARSCVLRIEAGGQRLLLTGDIDAAQELRLVREQPAAIAADYLQAPHHGSATASGEAFLAAARPAHVLIPVGHRNRYGHPHAEVLERIEASGARVWRTDRDGAIDLRLGAVSEITGARRERPRYWHGR